MPKVVFDSSFLMAVVRRPTTWHGDLTEELGRIEPVALECVMAEMERLSAGHGRRAKDALLAKRLAAGFQVVGCGGGSVDDEILSYAKSSGAVVATLDRELIRSLRLLGVRVATLRRNRATLH